MTEAELTILSLVAEGDRCGHEIQGVLDERGLREWLTVGFASVYYILSKLERQKLLEAKAAGRSPAQQCYRITEAGRGVLQTAVADLLRQPRALGAGFELGLINLHVLKPHQVYKVLTDHRADLQQRLDAIEQSWGRQQVNGDAPPVDHIRALYTHSITLMRAELEWMTAFIEDWLRRYPGADRAAARSEAEQSEHSAPTRLHRQPTPDLARMLQRLRRPPGAAEE
jgi:DNA-binding PadR family transcriptional regulator